MNSYFNTLQKRFSDFDGDGVKNRFDCRPFNKRMQHEPTLADHSEAWCSEKGRRVPKRGTKAWREMYEEWIEYAFEDFG